MVTHCASRFGGVGGEGMDTVGVESLVKASYALMLEGLRRKMQVCGA